MVEDMLAGIIILLSLVFKYTLKRSSPSNSVSSFTRKGQAVGSTNALSTHTKQYQKFGTGFLPKLFCKAFQWSNAHALLSYSPDLYCPR